MTGENRHVAQTPDTDAHTNAVRFVGETVYGTTLYTEWFTDASEDYLSGVEECLRLRGWVDLKTSVGSLLGSSIRLMLGLRRETRGEAGG